MAYNIVINRRAKDDLDNATEWYEEQRKQLGIEFFLEFYAHADYLSENATLYAYVVQPFRKMNMQRFPYAIYYAIDEPIITFILLLFGIKNEIIDD